MNSTPFQTPRRAHTWRWIVITILLLLLLVLWLTGYGPGGRNCNCAPGTNVSSGTVTGATPADSQVTVRWDSDDRVILEGEVGSIAAKKALFNDATKAFGSGKVVDRLTVQSGAAAVTSIKLAGAASNEDQKSARLLSATKAFGSGVQLDNQLEVTSIRRAGANSSATTAITEGGGCSKAMRVKVVFAVKQSEISPASEQVLNKVVECVKRPMEVGGHTDNQGTDERNLKLSQARANSVKAYLISKGVKADLLTAVGYGATKPIDDNNSKTGRARNRRIELIELVELNTK